MDQPVISKEQLAFWQPIAKRCNALVELVQGVQEFYAIGELSPEEKAHIETTVGAGLWYIRSSGLWTNKASATLLESYLPDSGIATPKWTADHEYPRKVAAAELLKFDWSSVDSPGSKLLELHMVRYGLVNYVAPSEKKRLTRYQKAEVFESPSAAYEAAGVVLVQVESQEWMLVRKRKRRVIEKLLAKST